MVNKFTYVDNLRGYYIKVLNKINSKFNEKFEEFNPKFNKNDELYVNINNIRYQIET
jgi:hypothetical protein